MARRFFIGLQTGHPDKSLFSEDLKEHLNASLLSDYRVSLAPLGPVESFVAAPVKTINGLETREYSISAGGHCLKLHLLVLANGLFEDVDVAETRCEP
jgi:hypothetical protein